MRRGAALAAVAGGLLATAPAAAQDATPLLETLAPSDGGLTALERYLGERDRLIIERIHRQSTLALDGDVFLDMEAVVAFEPARMEERMLGIRIRVQGTRLQGQAALTHLDLREVEELVRAIDLMDELLANEAGDAEIRHVSRDGFGVVAKRTKGRITFSVRLHGAPDGEPIEAAVDAATLTALRGQLEDSRLYLFQQ
ncbi:MAG: hypothetical protein ACR2PQ_06575 [Myxococcota bacterium]